MLSLTSLPSSPTPPRAGRPSLALSTRRRLCRTRTRHSVSPVDAGTVRMRVELTLPRPPARSEVLLNEGCNVVTLQRSETPELTALAGKYQGALIISKGDVSVEDDNKVRRPPSPSSSRSLVLTRLPRQAAVDVALQSFGRLDALIRASRLARPSCSLQASSRSGPSQSTPARSTRSAPSRPSRARGSTSSSSSSTSTSSRSSPSSPTPSRICAPATARTASPRASRPAGSSSSARAPRPAARRAGRPTSASQVHHLLAVESATSSRAS